MILNKTFSTIMICWSRVSTSCRMVIGKGQSQTKMVEAHILVLTGYFLFFFILFFLFFN